MPPPTLAAWLASAPFSLVMSSGFFGFFAHTGMLAALEESGLLPARVGGSSAGALVGGLWASGRGAGELSERLFALRREHFWDPAPGAGLLRGRLFRRQLEQALAAPTFARCRVPVHVSAYDLLARRVRVVESGELAPAIHASCAVPFLFHPVSLAGSLHVDGGVADRPGLAGARPQERVLFHHLASRSPWRAPDSPALAVPRRDDLVALVVRDLPRVGPFRLHEGKRAFERARQATRVALATAVSPVVSVP